MVNVKTLFKILWQGLGRQLQEYLASNANITSRIKSTNVAIGIVTIGWTMRIVMKINPAKDSRENAITNTDPKYTKKGVDQYKNPFQNMMEKNPHMKLLLT